MRSDARSLSFREPGLEAVRRELDRWRRSSGRGRGIPADLWERARELAREHGVSRTARELGLHYYSLANRMQGTGRGGDKDSAFEEASTFVELKMPTWSTPPDIARASCRLELSNGGGTRLSIELNGAGAEEIAALARGLWDGAR